MDKAKYIWKRDRNKPAAWILVKEGTELERLVHIESCFYFYTVPAVAPTVFFHEFSFKTYRQNFFEFWIDTLLLRAPRLKRKVKRLEQEG